MSEPVIVCPNCHSEIKLTESLAAPLIASTRQQYEQRIAEKEIEYGKRDNALREQQAALARARQDIGAQVDEQVSAKLKQERAAIVAEEARKAKLAVSTDVEKLTGELAEAHAVLKQREGKLAEAQKAQAELIRKQRELDDAKREMDLTIEKRVQDSLGAVREKSRKEAEQEQRLKVAEKEQTIVAMQRQIEELKRKAEQGSQQLQGEVQELALESMLQSRFPADAIEPVAKGIYGGDVVQRVAGPNGQPCGAILWESKRTKSWSDGWLPKLRGDQRAAHAEVAVLVSQALPKDVETFALIDDVWVVSFACAGPVATMLRHALIEIAATRQAGDGQQTKMALVYDYLMGPRFRHRVQAIVEKFKEMQQDLEKERAAITKQWAKREEQIRIVADATAGMFGDVQGIAGTSLQEIEGLDIKLLEGRD